MKFKETLNEKIMHLDTDFDIITNIHKYFADNDIGDAGVKGIKKQNGGYEFTVVTPDSEYDVSVKQIK